MRSLNYIRRNAVAFVALFVALGGTATAAAPLLKANSVGSREIKARSVRLSDLASDARPSSKSKLFRAAVSEVILDPGTQAAVDAIAGAVKGEKGDPGPAVQGPQGSAGAQGADGSTGAQGAQGPRGQALGYGHISSGGVIDSARTTNNAIVTKPSATTGRYCVKATDSTVRSVTVSLDADDPGTSNSLADANSTRVPPSDSPCAGYDLEVIVTRDIGAGTIVSVDHGLFLTLN